MYRVYQKEAIESIDLGRRSARRKGRNAHGICVIPYLCLAAKRARWVPRCKNAAIAARERNAVASTRRTVKIYGMGSIRPTAIRPMVH